MTATHAGTGDSSTVKINSIITFPPENDKQHVRATASIRSDSVFGTGSRGIARIDANLYNLRRGPGNYIGVDGDVWAGLYLNYNQDGSLSALAYAEEQIVTPLGQTEYHQLLSRYFEMPIAIDTDYILEIGFTGTHIVFQVTNPAGDTEVVLHEAPATVYPPFSKNFNLITRLYSGQDGGTMVAEWDDVFADPCTPMVTLDVNGDGTVDLADAIEALKVLTGLPADVAVPLADVNADGRLGLPEAGAILREVSQGR